MMKTNAYQLFKAMYLCLDKIWENNQEENLRIYLSDADPLFYENGQSLDPVVFEDFKTFYESSENKNLDDYEFVCLYLSNLDPYYGDIKQYFLSIDKKSFEKFL